jgi:formamidopyrimidine-DNA glycosylase
MHGSCVPELAEVEAYRRLAEAGAVGRRIVAVDAPDAWYLKGGLSSSDLESALVGRRITEARRIGKLLLLDTDGPTLGLRFGMSGRLIVDGVPGVEGLMYSSNGSEPRWDRFTLRLNRRGTLVMRDPRRLGGVSLDPPESRLGPDALDVSTAALRVVLATSDAPLKARIMDQARVAGVGNLAADEMLWRAGLDPARPARSLSDAEVRKLATTMRATLRSLLDRGGSHTGDLMEARAPGGQCPRDGAPLVRRTIGGRTTWSCPKHQV